jgi:hypothetical protein
MKEASILDIERKAVEHINALRRDTRISEEQLGKLAFPDAKNKRAKVNALRIPRSNTGSPLRFRLGDFCSLCHALGKNPAQELLLLWGPVDKENEHIS